MIRYVLAFAAGVVLGAALAVEGVIRNEERTGERIEVVVRRCAEPGCARRATHMIRNGAALEAERPTDRAFCARHALWAVR